MNKSGEETILSLPERHNRILALLQQNGSISVVQLAEYQVPGAAGRC